MSQMEERVDEDVNNIMQIGGSADEELNMSELSESSENENIRRNVY